MNLISELSSFLAAKKELQVVISSYKENFLEMILGRFAPNLRIENCTNIHIRFYKQELAQQNNVWSINFIRYLHRGFPYPTDAVELCHLVVTEELLFDFIKSSIEILQCST